MIKRRKRRTKQEMLQAKQEATQQNKETSVEEKGPDVKGKKISKKLQLTMKKIQKKFGSHAIKLADDKSLTINKIPSGIKSLDEALGGGFPVGMITELFGEESGGKGVIVAKTIANTQRANETCGYVDAEKVLDERWLKKLGVDSESMLHSEVTDADNVFDITKELIQSKDVRLLIVDSIAALTPKNEIENDMGKQSMGVLARIVNKGLRVSNALNSRQGTAVIFINQLRDKIGMVFGDPSTTPGGRGMKFFAAIRIRVKRGEWYPNRKERIGVEIVCQIVKNKTSMPYTEARFVLMNKTGEIKEWDELRGVKAKEENKITESPEDVEIAVEEAKGDEII